MLALRAIAVVWEGRILGRTDLPWPGDLGQFGNAASIIFSAGFLTASGFAQGRWRKAGLTVSGLFLILVNAVLAFSNGSERSDDQSDHRRAATVVAQNQSSQRSQWSQGRTEAATIAGEKAVAAYEAEVQQAIARDARRWQATVQCNPLKITLLSRKFCAEIAGLHEKLAAARRRDALDAKIEDLDHPKTDARQQGGHPSDQPKQAEVAHAAVYSFGSAILALADIRRSSGTPEEKARSLTAWRHLLRALMLELIAGMGPMGWIMMISGLAELAGGRPGAPLVPRPEKVARGEPKAVPATPQVSAATVPEPDVPLDDPFHRFRAERLEDYSGTSLPAGRPWAMWQEWCAENRIASGTQKAFGKKKMKTSFAWESNHNRPRYLNVRAKAQA